MGNYTFSWLLSVLDKCFYFYCSFLKGPDGEPGQYLGQVIKPSEYTGLKGDKGLRGYTGDPGMKGISGQKVKKKIIIYFII